MNAVSAKHSILSIGTKLYNMKTRLHILCFVFGIIGFTLGCQQYDKQTYLENYKNLIFEIKSNHSQLSEQDWIKYDQKFQKYSESDYDTFASELKPHEYLKIQRYSFLYKFYRGDIDLRSLISGEYNHVFKEMAIESSEIVQELIYLLKDVHDENKSTIIGKLLN